MKEKFSLKDALFNPQKVHQIASEIKSVYPAFAQENFEIESIDAFSRLELKERIDHLRDMLQKYLPDDYTEAMSILLEALPDELDRDKSDDDFGDFIYAPYASFASEYGCCDEHLIFSLEALREITKRFSVEFAIRDFIKLYPNETLQMLETCSCSSHYHERRLASEGLRPRLPWAKRLTIDHHLPLQYLDNLFSDPTRYVTRSVANHLNDISKIDASLVIDRLKEWKASGKQENKEMDYILNHALRTLVKEGNEEALALLGYIKNPDIVVSDFVLEHQEINIGDALVFQFELEAKKEMKLMIDYAIHFKTKRNLYSQKVHKLKRVHLCKGEKIMIKKRHPFRANMTTRKLYEGEHKVELQINGRCYANETFFLRRPNEF